MASTSAVGSTNSNAVDMFNTENQVDRQKIKHSKASNDNEVGQSNDSGAQTNNGNPTASARETVTAQHKDVEEMTEDRCRENPEYVALQDKLAACEGLEEMFLLIDKNVGWRDDGIVLMSDILALVNDTNQPNTKLRESAKWLNDHRDVLFALKKGDDRIGLHDVQNFIAGMKAELKGMKDVARAEVKEEMGIKTGTQTGATQSAATAGSPEGAAIMTEAGQALPKPVPSQMSGLEGASENLNNMIGWGESEIDRLTTLMGKTDDPAVLKQLENKINQMSRRMQQMTALMNQIMTAMQNISKMYSDIAMNSVRNIR
jgi:hypothetical protein